MMGTNAPYKPTLADKWAIGGTWVILAVIASLTHGLGITLQGLWQFASGNVAALKATPYDYEWLLPAVLGSVVIAIPLMLAADWLAQRVYGKATSNIFQRRTMGLRKVPGATGLLLAVTVKRDVIDELWARGFILGLLALPLGTVIGEVPAFYLLFTASAIPQILEYRHHYQDKKEQRQLGRLLPQFFGMVILAVIFVQFGLLASVIVHVLYNLVLASLDRFTARQRQGIWRVFVASGLLTIVSFALLNEPFSRITHFEFYDFYHYLWAVLGLSGLLMFVLELLLYDPEPKEGYLPPHKVPTGPSVAEAIFKNHYRLESTPVHFTTRDLFVSEISNAIQATFVLCVWVGVGYTVIHFLPAAQPYWLAIVATPAVFFYIAGSSSVSINGTARLVWENAPVLLLIIQAFLVLGFWPGVLIMVVRELVCRLIRRPIRYAGLG